LAGTLQTVYRKSFKKNGSATFEIEQETSTSEGKPISNITAGPLSQDKIQELRAMGKKEIMDKLRMDVAKMGQIPPDSIDNDTALVTILDSITISQFKGRLESIYAVKISDEYLFGESVTLKKLAEVVKLGYAPNDVGGEASNNNNNNGPSSSSSAPASQGENAEGLAGMLGCPPGVKVCCVIQ
jgi:acyl carrier protein